MRPLGKVVSVCVTFANRWTDGRTLDAMLCDELCWLTKSAKLKTDLPSHHTIHHYMMGSVGAHLKMLIHPQMLWVKEKRAWSFCRLGSEFNWLAAVKLWDRHINVTSWNMLPVAWCSHTRRNLQFYIRMNLWSTRNKCFVPLNLKYRLCPWYWNSSWRTQD